MEYNKVYFTIYNRSNVETNLKAFNIKRLLGFLYDKYNAFSIKLESYSCRSANTTVVADDYYLLHLEGLNFFNGFDTSPLYNGGRAIEMIDFTASGYNFISNCNAINFYHPRANIIDLQIYYSKITDDTKVVIPPDDNFMIFSITGLSQYKIHKPHKPLIYRTTNIRTSTFTLSTFKATSIDSRNRAWKFRNIDLRNIIGSDYDKYNKFVLITKSFNFVQSYPTFPYAPNSGNALFNLFLSGLSFNSTSWIPGNATSTDPGYLSSIHPTTPVCICSGTLNTLVIKETYIENAFMKSSGLIDINLSINSLYGYQLIPVNTGNTDLFPNFNITFDILPLED